jgi:DNA-binding MarR family transcriptional regulator
MTRTAPPAEALLLDNQLCFMVYRLHRGITDLYRPLLGELGLTYPQYLVMLVLWESAPLTVSEIGGRLSLDSGTLSPLLKRLESAGLITRTRSAEDERSVRIALTGQGEDLREQAARVPLEIGQCLAASADDYGVTREFLAGLLGRVDEAVAVAGSA